MHRSAAATIDEAFDRVPRANFLPADVRQYALIDTALPIGFGQTNSQPIVVEQMLEWLDAGPGMRILDVGSGSGWTTALLAALAGSDGHVYAVEAVAELLEFGRANCERFGIDNVSFHMAGPVLGLPSHAPYDRILVSAASDQVPNELLEQIEAGKLIIPVRYDILEITKHDAGSNDTITHPGYVFVPLTRYS